MARLSAAARRRPRFGGRPSRAASGPNAWHAYCSIGDARGGRRSSTHSSPFAPALLRALPRDKRALVARSIASIGNRARFSRLAYSRTYSYSIGRLLMPRSGGAIQPAILPGATTCCIRLLHERAVGLGRQPFAFAPAKFVLVDDRTVRVAVHAGPDADRAVKARRRQRQSLSDAGALELTVPALEPELAVADVRRAQHFVHRVAHRNALRSRCRRAGSGCASSNATSTQR